MTFKVARTFYISLGLLLAGCALPTPEVGTGGFVAQSDFDVVGLSRLGQRAYAKGNYLDAISYFDQALKIAPDSPSVRLNRAIALAHDKQWELAQPEFDALLRRYPNVARYHLAYGESLLALDKYQQAIRELEFGYTLASTDKDVSASAAHNLAQANLEAGFYDEARCWAVTSFAIEANTDRAAYGVSVLNTIGEVSAAYQFGVSAVAALVPAAPSQELLLGLATASFSMGDCQQALSFSSRVLDNVVNIDPHTKFGAVVVAELCSPAGESGGDFQAPLREYERRTWPAALVSAYAQRHESSG